MNNKTSSLSQGSHNPKVEKAQKINAMEDKKTQASLQKADKVLQNVKYTLSKQNYDKKDAKPT